MRDTPRRMTPKRDLVTEKDENAIRHRFAREIPGRPGRFRGVQAVEAVTEGSPSARRCAGTKGTATRGQPDGRPHLKVPPDPGLSGVPAGQLQVGPPPGAGRARPTDAYPRRALPPDHHGSGSPAHAGPGAPLALPSPSGRVTLAPGNHQSLRRQRGVLGVARTDGTTAPQRLISIEASNGRKHRRRDGLEAGGLRSQSSARGSGRGWTAAGGANVRPLCAAGGTPDGTRQDGDPNLARPALRPPTLRRVDISSAIALVWRGPSTNPGGRSRSTNSCRGDTGRWDPPVPSRTGTVQNTAPPPAHPGPVRPHRHRSVDGKRPPALVAAEPGRGAPPLRRRRLPPEQPGAGGRGA
jgi:hypothetical protein